MRQKLDTLSAARIDARCPVDTGNRRRQDVAGAARVAGAQRRPRLTGAPYARRRPKSRPAPLIRRGAPTLVLPTAIPVTPRELDVIETYLGELLDEALGKRE
jgi:hypothetical protein